MPKIDQDSLKMDACDRHLLSHHRYHLDNNGYIARLRMDGKKLTKGLLHRDIMQPPPGLQVDHINGDRADNRRSNLRVVTHKENMQNMHHLKPETKSKSGFRGVYLRPNGKWEATLRLDGKRRYLGVYASVFEAASVAEKHYLALMPYYVPTRQPLTQKLADEAQEEG